MHPQANRLRIQQSSRPNYQGTQCPRNSDPPTNVLFFVWVFSAFFSISTYGGCKSKLPIFRKQKSEQCSDFCLFHRVIFFWFAKSFVFVSTCGQVIIFPFFFHPVLVCFFHNFFLVFFPDFQRPQVAQNATRDGSRRCGSVVSRVIADLRLPQVEKQKSQKHASSPGFGPDLVARNSSCLLPAHRRTPG